MRLKIPPVYPITDKALAGRNTHLSILKELVRGGAQFVQIRDKSTPLVALLDDLNRCQAFAARHGVILIVNDRCDLALCCGTGGVHVGEDDLPPEAARAVLGRGKIIGLSTHSRAGVRRASAMPVDYIGFGPVFPTSTKADAAPVAGLATLRAAVRISSKPVVAIGGIGIDRLRPVLDAGAASAAVVSALMCAPDIARAMERFLQTASVRNS